MPQSNSKNDCTGSVQNSKYLSTPQWPLTLWVSSDEPVEMFLPMQSPMDSIAQRIEMQKEADMSEYLRVFHRSELP